MPPVGHHSIRLRPIGAGRLCRGNIRTLATEFKPGIFPRMLIYGWPATLLRHETRRLETAQTAFKKLNRIHKLFP
jgi:hypothetical protein